MVTKNESTSDTNLWSLGLLGLLAYVITWGMFIVLFQYKSFTQVYELVDWLPLIGTTSLIGFITGVVQQFLVRKMFNVDLAGWWWKSTIIWAGAGLIWYVVNTAPAIFSFMSGLNRSLSNALFIAIYMIFFLVPPTLIQAWLLRKQLDRVWLLPIVGLIGILLFAFPIDFIKGIIIDWAFDNSVSITLNTTRNIVYALFGLSQGIVVGICLIYLFRTRHNPS